MMEVLKLFYLKHMLNNSTENFLEVNATIAVLSSSNWLYHFDTNLYLFIHGLSLLRYLHVYRELCRCLPFVFYFLVKIV